MSRHSEQQRWGRLQELFEAVLEQPPELREAWLSQEVPDAGLRAEVRGLVRSHGEAGALDRLSSALAGRITRSEDRAGGPSDGAPDRVASAELPERVGPYRILEKVGEGGMAIVYRGRREDGAGKPDVAVKVIRQEVDSPRLRRRFATESAVLERLKHPFIARFLGRGTTEAGSPYLVTELVDGLPIHHFCRAEKPSLEDRVALVLRLCDALEYAHGNGVIHRDIKPRNVLVTRDGELRVLDFGIAKVLEEGSLGELSRKTTTGVRMMTFRYASPEQILGQPVTERSDIHQAGSLLYLLVTGEPPSRASKITPRMPGGMKVGRAPPLSHPVLEAEGLDDIVVRACKEEPEERYSSAADLGQALREWLSGRDR